MKKTILGAVAALLCSAVFAEMDLAGGTLTFVNKLDIEPVLYTKGSYLPVSDSNVSYGAFIVNVLFFNKRHYKGGIYSNSDYKPYYKTNLGFYASFDANKWLGQNLTVNTSKNGMSLLELNCARKEQTSCLLLSGTFVRCCKSF